MIGYGYVSKLSCKCDCLLCSSLPDSWGGDYRMGGFTGGGGGLGDNGDVSETLTSITNVAGECCNAGLVYLCD